MEVDASEFKKKEGSLHIADRKKAKKISASRRNASFTLVELLVVLGIIALLAAVLIPALASLSKSNGRKGAASMLIGALENARTLAIKDGRATYAVFAAHPIGNSSSITDQALLDRYFYHSVAIFEDDATDAAKPKVQISPWKTFPTGVVLRTEISFQAPDPPQTTQNNAVWKTDVSFTFTPASPALRNQSFPYIKYDESGALVTPLPLNPGSVLLRFFEGYVSGTTEHSTTSANKDELINLAGVTGRPTYIP